jgi:hypothetical protein
MNHSWKNRLLKYNQQHPTACNYLQKGGNIDNIDNVVDQNTETKYNKITINGITVSLNIRKGIAVLKKLIKAV